LILPGSSRQRGSIGRLCSELSTDGRVLKPAYDIGHFAGFKIVAVERFAPLPITSSRTSQLGGTVATIDFPDIGLQGFAPKLAKGEIASLILCKNRLPPTAENHPCET
jgi:hypothetical protein